MILGNGMRKGNKEIKIKQSIIPEFSSGSSTLVVSRLQQRPAWKPLKQVQGSSNRHIYGFTLVELLVVVLIIAVLAAIALPQYQRAVRKAAFTEYQTWTKNALQAEELYFLEHGAYTDDLVALGIPAPKTGCRLSNNKWGKFYECGNEKFGIFNNITNVQAGYDKSNPKRKLRYLRFFGSMVECNTTHVKGDRSCFSVGTAEIKLCESLGNAKKKFSCNGDTRYIY